MTTPVLHYIYDPLCGWCYGAKPLIDAARGIVPVVAHGGGINLGQTVSETFALACLVPAEVNAFVDEIPGMEEYQEREFERSREHDLLRQYGYIDGKNFQNAGDKERLAE
mgnify:CR=1 FL=1